MNHYFSERFNPFSMGFLAGVLGLSCSTLVAFVKNSPFELWTTVLTIAALFLFLLRLRVFDEVKDATHDLKYHPERPVPRGLVTLQELQVLVSVTSLIELGIAAITGSFLFFFISAGYSLLMFREFFVPNWLKKHFTFYIFSHEVLMIPLTCYLYSVAGASLSDLLNRDLLVFIVAVTSAMFSLELSRKIRAPEAETGGKDTYTSQYGILWASVLLEVILLVIGAVTIFFIQNLVFLIPLLATGILVTARLITFARQPTSKASTLVFVTTSLYAFCAQFTLIIYWISQQYGDHFR